MKFFSTLGVASGLATALASTLILSTLLAAPAAAAVTTLSGAVSSGSAAKPLDRVTVSLYRTGSSVPLAVAQTNAQGRFQTTPLQLADDGSVYYALAVRHHIVLLAVLGRTPPTSFVINELTTVAAAYANAQLLAGRQIGGALQSQQAAAGMSARLVSVLDGAATQAMRSSPNANETNAWRLLGSLGNMLAACVQERVRWSNGACDNLFKLTTDPRSGAESIDTLQAILQIARNPAARVAELFDLSRRLRSYQPDLSDLQGPRSTDGFQKLDAWTLAFKVNDTGSPSCPFGGPANISFDRNGYAWVNHNVVQGTADSTHCQAVLKPDGSPADGQNNTPRSPLTGGGIQGPGFGIAVDQRGDVWMGNMGWGKDVPEAGSVSRFSAAGAPLSPAKGYVQGLYRTQGTAVDQSNNLWMASYGLVVKPNENPPSFDDSNAVVVYPNGNPEQAIKYTEASQAHPFGMAVDAAGQAWVSYTGADKVVRFTLNNATRQLVKDMEVALDAGANAKGIAIDSLGTAWAVAGGNSTLYQISGSKALAWTGRGMNGPWGIAVDGADNLWIANFGGKVDALTRYSVVHLCGTTAKCPPGLKTGDPISPPGGYSLPSAGDQVLLANGDPLYGRGGPPSYRPLQRMTSANIDMAGNVWAANNWKPESAEDTVNPGGDGIVIFIGIGTPTQPLWKGPACPASAASCFLAQIAR